MGGEAVCLFALFLVNSLTVDLVAIKVGNKGVIVGNMKTKFFEIGIFGEFKFLADINSGELPTHFNLCGVIVITVTETSFAGFPVGDIVIGRCPISHIT